MKKMLFLCLNLLLITGFFMKGYSQDDVSQSNEIYVKSNIAVTKFQLLGVTKKQYAKCVSSENYLEPEKKLKFLVIDKTCFTDDGQGYDLLANDGILTSNILFPNSQTRYIQPGNYEFSPEYETVIADPLFGYHRTMSGTEKLIIGCKFKWTPCNQMVGLNRTLCTMAGWPFGSFTITECEIKWEW